jgi:hypothetical protein
MWQYLLKVAITSVVIVAVAEIAKRNVFWAALLDSLPLVTLLAFIWLYLDTGDTARIAALSWSVFWLVLPSLVLLLLLPLLLRIGWNFWLSLGVSCFTTAALYWLMVWLLGRIGVSI